MPNNRLNFLVIGCGNMALALTPGMDLEKVHFICYTPSVKSAETLANTLCQKKGSAEVLVSLKDLAKKLEHTELHYVMIACKPQQFSVLVTELRELKLLNNPRFLSAIVISLMAGVNISLIKESWSSQIIRLMPSTPSKIGKGVLLFAGNVANEAQLTSVFKSCGHIHFCSKEQELSTLTPYSASGPGLIFKVIEYWQQDLEKRGISKQVSKKILAMTFLGSGEMLLNSDLDANELCTQVTSKGGVTFEALKVFQEENLAGIMEMAFEKALHRSFELEQQVKQMIKGDS